MELWPSLAGIWICNKNPTDTYHMQARKLHAGPTQSSPLCVEFLGFLAYQGRTRRTFSDFLFVRSLVIFYRCMLEAAGRAASRVL